jgi:hypothetical protein
MNEEATKERLIEAFIDLTGGRLAWILAEKHFAEGESIRNLVELFNHELSRSAIHRKINHVWNQSGKYGVRPAYWRRHAPGGPRKPKTNGTPNEVYQARLDRRHNGRPMIE